MDVNGTEYYFLKNAQGDISHIVDEDGNEVASYEYDACGNHLSVTGGEIAELNPYRYRGYRYDSETGLYYLQSRYYNPEWGRFINADVLLGLGDYANIFTYCKNNPISHYDFNGMFPVSTVAGAFIGGVVGGVKAKIRGQDVMTGIIAGAASGALIGLAIDATIMTCGVAGVVVAGTLAGGVGGVASSVIEQTGNSWKWGANNASLKESFQKVNWQDVVVSGVVGAATGAASGLTAGVLHAAAQTSIPIYRDAVLSGAPQRVIDATRSALIASHARAGVAGVVADTIYACGTAIFPAQSQGTRQIAPYRPIPVGASGAYLI